MLNSNFFALPLQSLRTLIQGRQGITWTLGSSLEVTELITNYTDGLLEQGLVDKIISKEYYNFINYRVYPGSVVYLMYESHSSQNERDQILFV